MKLLIASILTLVTLAASVSANTTGIDLLLPDTPQMSVPEGEIELANHYGTGVMERRFVGAGRCSQVCPIMRDIANGHCSSQGQCWCDEQSGGVTIAYLVCN